MAALHGTAAPQVPQGAALSDLIATHYTAMLSFYGTDLGTRVARKHLGWYMDRAGTAPDLRRAILTTRIPAEVLRLIADIPQDAATGGPEGASTEGASPEGVPKGDRRAA